MKSFSLFFSLFVFLASQLFAQTNIIDSLKAELDASASDSNRANILNALSKNYLNSDIEKALNYSAKAEELSIEIGYAGGRIDAILRRSVAEEMHGNYEEAIRIAKTGLDLSKEHGLPKKACRALSSLGAKYYVIGEYAKAIEYFLIALETAEELNDTVLIPALLNNIGSIYYRTGDKERALHYFKETMPIYEKLNKIDELAVIKLNIGAIYRDEKKIDEAEDYFLQSMNLAKQAGDSLRVAFALNNLSGLYFDIEDYETSLEYLLKSYRIKKNLGSKNDVARALANIGALYGEMNNYTEAIDYSMKSLELAEEINASPLVLNSYEIISEIYLKQKDYENTYKYSDLYHSLKDSLDAINNSKIAEIQNGYESKRILTENEKLQLENEYRSNIIFYQRIIVIVSIIMIGLASIFAAVFLKQKNKLDRLNSLKDNFFSVVAHDLRNPVNSIQNIAGVLSTEYDEIDEKDKAELTGILQKSANKLNGLISNLFTWSTFQQGISRYNPEKYNIALALKETTDILKHNASDKNIELKYYADSELYVEADKEMIDSVILNLITNAIKFSPSNSTINISVYKRESFAELLVEDNGVGIPEDIQSTLFKFDNNKSSHGTSGEKGSGLGLMICKEFVEKNKGTIWFESEVDKGSRFFVRLPLA